MSDSITLTGQTNGTVTLTGGSGGTLIFQGVSQGIKGDKGDQGDPATNLVTSVAGKTGAVSLTKDDVGLSNVDNTSDADKPVSTATQTALDAKATITALDAHTNNTANPHSVTKAQVGLGNVQNLAPADMPVSTDTQTALDAKANASDTVNLTGNQTVAGVKTFSSSPVVPTATTSTHAVNKSQMDTALDGKATLINIPQFSVPYRTTAGNGEPNTSYTVSGGTTPGTLAARDGAGALSAAAATQVYHVVRKDQMDTADALKVSKAGDAMTGTLTVTRTSPDRSVIISGNPTDRPLEIVGNNSDTIRAFIVNNGSGDSQVSFGNSNGTRWSAGYNAHDDSFSIANAYDINNKTFSVGAGGQLTIGSIRYFQGTGFPNGVVSAPVGSIYIDTAITNGASSWIKKSGTGNTGWNVLEGDTGVRGVTPTDGTGTVVVHRASNAVTLQVSITTSATIASGGVIYTLPVGFRPVVNYNGTYGQAGAAPTKIITIGTSGTIALWGGPIASTTVSASLTFITSNGWPSTLPGTAV